MARLLVVLAVGCAAAPPPPVSVRDSAGIAIVVITAPDSTPSATSGRWSGT